ncbi:MAG: DUF6128 domain-containing protein [Eubacterium sp.]|nr:DUF6128 domain-containing protein [Eubacterium sp.]
MADYQRILSYLYRYDNRQKKECKGFIKAEQKADGLKLTIQIEDERLMEEMPMRLCFYADKDDRKVTVLDRLTLGKQHEEIFRHYENDRLPTGFRIQNQAGVILYYQDSFFYGSVWIGEELPAIEQISQLFSGEKEAETFPEKVAEEPEEPGEPGEENTFPGEPAEEPEESEEKPEEPREENIFPEEMSAQMMSEGSKPEKKDFFDRIKKEARPACSIFNPAFYEGYLISDNQLPLLGKEAEKFSDNQFLCSGYAKHHHLLAGKVRYDARDRYCIGVPGIYENREKYMAEIYQFPVFLALAENRIKTGGFGYWLHLLPEEK